MAPAQKRKRGDRTYSQDSNGGGRPSPHRPENLNTAQHNQYGNQRGARRGSRGGGRGGSQTPRSPVAPSSHVSPLSTKTSPTTMSPPLIPNTSKSPATLQPPAQPTPTPQAPAVQPISSSATDLTPYYYEYLTDDCRASWSAAGKKAIIDAGTRAITEDDPIILSTIFQEIVRAVLDGQLDPTEGGHTVRDILKAPNENNWLDPQSLFLDSLSIIMEMEPAQPSLRVLVCATNIDPAKLRLELESSLLESLGLVRNTFYKMSIRKATSALYRMSAYNLLREESEGYSKLLTEYFTTVQDRGSEGPRSAVVAETWGRVKALIGAFDLDVGRVLDVTLDVAANMLIKRGDFFVKFFRISTWWPRERVIENVEWVHQGFTSLPRWAEPGVDRWTLTEEEKAQLSALREVRDENFWRRVNEVGMDAYFEIGGRRITNGDAQAAVSGASLEAEESESGTKLTDPHDDVKWAMQWMKTTGTLPPQGNRIAAQLLGFKLRFYASDSRDASDVLPDNLIALTALLIKIGFISLVDLYPHLYPPDEDMSALKDKLMKDKEEREKKARPGGGTKNALATAGALPDDTLPAPVSRLRAEESRASSVKPDEKAGTPARTEEERDQLPEPVNQKYELLKSLLCMGCIPEALFILGRFPWMMDGYPDLPQHVNRLLHLSIKNIYDPVRPLADEPALHELQADVAEASAVSKGPLKFVEGVPRRNMRWTKIEAVDADGTGVDYRYFWETWADNIPMCQTVDDVFLLCDTLLNLSGVKIGQDPKLLVKLARIGRHSLNNDSSDVNFARWIELSKRLLVPALSLTNGNLGAVNEMWELLKLFPTKVRYNIYAEWFTGQTSRLPDVKIAFDLTRAQTKDVLKRISKTNVRLMARNLAKVTLSSPGVVFSVTLNQIESYDNLIQTVIECTKYFTYLAYDVLHWALLSALGGGGRSRMQEDGMLTSSWLRALSQYTGGIFKQYKVMSPTPILQYVTDQLRRGNSTDLEILEQMLTEMAGIRSDMNFTEIQTQAMGGGPVLQSQTLQQLHDQRHERATQDSSRRLLRSLLGSGIAAPLLIAIAQERQMYPYRESVADAPLKVLGNNLDKIHQVLIQYLDVLRANLPAKKFDEVIPELSVLISDFGMDASIAFTICRASIHQEMVASDAVAKEKHEKDKEETKAMSRPESQDNAAGNEDVEMADPSKSATPAEADSTANHEDVEMKDSLQGGDGSTSHAAAPTATPATVDTPWHPILREVMSKVKGSLPENFEQSMSLSFYVSFWQLSLYDIFVPTSLYEEEQKRQKDHIQEINRDRSDISTEGMKRKNRLREACNATFDKLAAEMKTHVSTYQATRNRLKKESVEWFRDFPASKIESLMDTILQECFLPRMLLSSVDALYAYKMLMLIHSTGTPGFRTVKFLDQFFREKQLTALIFHCTSREAENFGRFLSELLKELERWRSESSIYVKFAHGIKKDLPGFARKFGKDKRPDGLIDYEDFRRVLYKWHTQLNAAFKACLSSSEYMHIRNAITILKTVRNHFPAVNWTGKAIMECIKGLQKDSREDIKLAANAIMADLLRREKDWITPQAFRLADPNQVAAKSASRGGSAHPSTPQSTTTGAKSLNASAAEFKPGAAPSTRTTGDDLSKKEVEDGEIDDAAKLKQESQATPAAATSEPGPETSTSLPASMPIPTAAAAEEDGVQPTTAVTAAAPPAATSTTPAPVQSPSPSVPPRPETNRGTPSQSVQSRTTHALPSRPEPPPRRPDDRPSDYHGHARGRPSQHDTRRPHDPEYGRLERPGDLYNHGYRDPRERSPDRRSRGRTPERDRRDQPWPAGREPRHYQDERGMRPTPRDGRPDPGRQSGWDGPRDGWADPPRDAGRDSRSDHARASGWADGQREPWDSRESRLPPPGPDHRGRGAGPHAVGPSTSAASTLSSFHGANREPLAHGDRTNLSQAGPPPQSQPSMNPDRAALVEHDAQRLDRDTRRERGSRPHSPRRDDGRLPAPYPSRPDGSRGGNRDERGSGPPPSSMPVPRDRHEEQSGAPPTGPRGGAHPGHTPSGVGRGQPGQSPRGPIDPEYGRLTRDFPPPSRPQQDPNYGRLQQQDTHYGRLQQDPNYGRLNAGSDIPSGPRGRGTMGRGGRNFTAPAGPGPSGPGPAGGQGLPGMPPSPATERPPQRDHRANQPDQPPAHTSNPPTPSSEHPPVELGGIHPSRRRQLQVTPLQTDISAATGTGAPPSGPRGRGPPNSAGMGLSPSARNPPTGPTSAIERDQRTPRQQYPLNNISNHPENNPNTTMLDRPANDRGASIRGRATRQSANANIATAASSSSSQPSTPGGNRMEGPPSQMPQQNPLPAPRGADLFANRMPHGEGYYQPPSDASYPPSQDERSDSRRRDRRPGRHRSKSRSPRPERESRESGRRDDAYNDPRDKWTNGEAGGRELRRGREEGRDPGRERNDRGDRERDRSDRGERGDRDRERRELRDAPPPGPLKGGMELRRGGNQGPPLPPPSGPPVMEPWDPSRGNEGRGRDRRDGGDRGGRDGRKRGRIPDEMMGQGHGDNKRPRRNG